MDRNTERHGCYLLLVLALVVPALSVEMTFLYEDEGSGSGASSLILPCPSSTVFSTTGSSFAISPHTPFTTIQLTPTASMEVEPSPTSAIVSQLSSLQPTSSLLSSLSLSTPIPMTTGLVSTLPSILMPTTSNAVTPLLRQSSSSVTTNALSVNLPITDAPPGVPLPVLIAAPAGAVALISLLFIIIVLCFVRCRKRRKYTLKTVENNLESNNNARRSTTPAAQDLKEINVDTNKKLQGFGISDETTAATFGIEFPETPKYGSNENMPALIILNPVKAIEPSSNALWSQTLPTRQKIRKQMYSESDVPNQPDSCGLKPAKSISAIDTVTKNTDVDNKVNDGTSLTLLIPEEKRKLIAAEDEYDHLSPEDLPDGADGKLGTSALGNVEQVFLEPAVKSSTEKEQKVSNSPPGVGPDDDQDAIYLQPSSIPAPSQPPQHMLPTDSATTPADTETVYDTPKSSGVEASLLSLQEGKLASGSGPLLSCSRTREMVANHEIPSHYDVPKNALLSLKLDAPAKLGFRAQSSSGVGEASQQLGSPLESHYDSLGAHSASQQPHSPPYYDIPKHLLLIKNTSTSGKQDVGQETSNVDDVKQLESSDEHVYCVPPDVAVTVLKPIQNRLSKAEATPKREKADNANASEKPKAEKSKKEKVEDGITSAKPSTEAASGVKAEVTVAAAKSKVEASTSHEEKNGDTVVSKAEVFKKAKPRNAAKAVVEISPRKEKVGSGVKVVAEMSKKDKIENANNSAIKPVPMRRKKTDNTPRNSLAFAPAAPKPPKRPTNLVKNGSNSVSSSLEDLLQDSEKKKDEISRPTTPKPTVARKPKVLPKNSTSSISSSTEDLLQGPPRPTTPKPAIAKKPKVRPKASTSSAVTSSQEELLHNSDRTESSTEPQNVIVNGEARTGSERMSESPVSGETGNPNLKPKPKVIPRSHSRQAIVSGDVAQELLAKQQITSTGNANTNLSPKRVPPKRPPPLTKPMLNVSN